MNNTNFKLLIDWYSVLQICWRVTRNKTMHPLLLPNLCIHSINWKKSLYTLFVATCLSLPAPSPLPFLKESITIQTVTPEALQCATSTCPGRGNSTGEQQHSLRTQVYLRQHIIHSLLYTSIFKSPTYTLELERGNGY